jgi:hypothetical protein
MLGAPAITLGVLVMAVSMCGVESLASKAAVAPAAASLKALPKNPVLFQINTVRNSLLVVLHLIILCPVVSTKPP